MNDVMLWLQSSALGVLMRESGVWTYAIVNLAHIFGIALLFGSTVILDLSLLGTRPRVPAGAVADLASPVAAAGFVIAVLSGTAMLTANATDYTTNPFLYIKLPIVAIGFINAAWIVRSRAWRACRAGTLSDGDRRALGRRAAVSLVCWTAAIAAGRMIGYW